jgi:4a-hydroxytetrahydrobiopterin dehydratase
MAAEYRLVSQQELEEKLEQLKPNWRLEGGKLYRRLEFRDFVECFSFMVKVALEAEKMQHHPEWLNVYNRDMAHYTAGGILLQPFPRGLSLFQRGLLHTPQPS